MRGESLPKRLYFLEFWIRPLIEAGSFWAKGPEREIEEMEAANFDLAISLVSLEDLEPYERNARTHPQEQIEQIKASVRAFGFANPLISDLDAGGVLVAGHGRLIAIKEMLAEGEAIRLPDGRDLPAGFLPTIDCSGWTEEQRRAYTLADNRIAENSGWDEELLALELGEIGEAFDATADLGFSAEHLANIFADRNEGNGQPDKAPDLQENCVTEPGDIWILGSHRIMCGDSTSSEAVNRLLNGTKPNLMVTDPPYGVKYDADWRNHTGDANRSDRVVGVVMNDDRADWSEAYALFPGEVAYVWHAGNKAGEFQSSLEKEGFEIRAQIIWAKHQMVISRGNYHGKHEPCWYAVRQGATANWQGSRKETTLWEIDKPRKSETGHSTQKPVDCMRRPMLNNSMPGDLVYEPFSGSGTTIIAGEMEARSVRAMELNPAYVDLAVRRWQEFSGKTAVLQSDGKTFADVEADRTT